jgi:hypothetical protein
MWIKASAIRKWKEDVSGVNPLDKEFRGVRLKWLDIMNPVSRRIEGKSFHGCELMGPANLFFWQNVFNNRTEFAGCTVVVLKKAEDGGVYPGSSSIMLKNVEIHNSSIYNCTIFIPPDMAMEFARIGTPIITLSGVPEIDSLPLLGTAEGRRLSPPRLILLFRFRSVS